MEPFISRNVDLSNMHMGKDWIYVGLDLGENVWVAGALNLRICGYHSKQFRSENPWDEFVKWVADLRKREACRVHVLYEVGRQGFELARQLREMGVDTDIVAVSRLSRACGKRKRGKSDAMDAKALAYMDWTADGFPLVWVPDRKQEELRNLLMWEDQLLRSVRVCRNRSLSILTRWGVRGGRGRSIEKYRTLLAGIPNGMVGQVDHLRLGSLLAEELSLRSQVAVVMAECRKRLTADSTVKKLMQWRGIGEKTAKVLAWYVGDWDRFPNGRSFAAYCGLTSVHVRSGSSDLDVGLSRAGHRLLRATFGHLAMLWSKWQPDCLHVQAAAARMTKGKARRLARTALARQLAVAVWSWIVRDKPIEGARRREES